VHPVSPAAQGVPPALLQGTPAQQEEVVLHSWP
jgi:hypothetical protein